MTNREAIASLKTLCNTCKCFPTCVNSKPECFKAIEMAISALKKQEQTNAQSVNSTHTSRPNALESLNILEQAKDDKGCVPMSLVRQAFRNVLEQDRWIPVTERMPEEKVDVLCCFTTHDKSRLRVSHRVDYNYWSEVGRTGDMVAWRPLPEPYTEEES